MRTVEELEASLTNDLKWRKQELLNFEYTVGRAREHVLPALLRSGVPLIYAHWEGYVKHAASRYLEHISFKGLNIGDLRPEIAAIAVRKEIAAAGSQSDSTSQSLLIEKLWSSKNEKADIPRNGSSINTRANLRFSQFSSIMRSIGCDSSRHATKEKIIDERLLRPRNSISHGQEEYVDFESWVDLKGVVIEILNDVRSQVADSAAMKMYLYDESCSECNR